MACSNDNEWLDARIARTKELIEALEDGIEQVTSTGQSYTYDSGQTRYVVTQANIVSINNTIAELYKRLAILQAKRCGPGTRVKPAW